MQAGVKDKYIVSKGADNYVEVRYALQFLSQRLPKDMFDMYACVQMHKSTWRSMTYVMHVKWPAVLCMYVSMLDIAVHRHVHLIHIQSHTHQHTHMHE